MLPFLRPRPPMMTNTMTGGTGPAKQQLPKPPSGGGIGFGGGGGIKIPRPTLGPGRVGSFKKSLRGGVV